MRGNLHTLDGRTQCLKHWAREFNIDAKTVQKRLDRGLELRTALTGRRVNNGRSAMADYGVLAVWRAWIMAPTLVSEVSENIVI